MSPKDKLDEIKKRELDLDTLEGMIELNEQREFLITQLEKAWERESKLLLPLKAISQSPKSEIDAAIALKAIRDHAKEVET